MECQISAILRCKLSGMVGKLLHCAKVLEIHTITVVKVPSLRRGGQEVIVFTIYMYMAYSFNDNNKKTALNST